MHLRRHLTAVLTVLALLAAACGDSGGDAGPTDTAAPDTTPAEQPTDTTAPEQPADTTAPDTTPPDTAPELTASARGITADTIRIGLAIPDVSRFSNSGEQVPRFRVVADAINADGGLIGRQIELIPVEWDLLETSGFDEACIKLTEDDEVFAVITRTPANFGDTTCFTAIHDTLTVNALEVSETEAEQSGGLLYSTRSDRFGAFVAALDDVVAEIDGEKVAVTASTEGGNEANARALADMLRDRGVDVVAVTIGTVAYADDQIAALAEQDRFAEQWRSAGATKVIAIGNAISGAAYAIDNNALHDRMELILPSVGVRTIGALITDPAPLRMVGIAAPDEGNAAATGTAGSAECIDRVETELGEEVIFFPEEEELNALPSTFAGCDTFAFLQALLEAAGPNPTQDDVLAVLADGISFSMASTDHASARIGKPFLNDEPGIVWDWDPEARVFHPRG